MNRGGAPGRVPDARSLPLAARVAELARRRATRVRSPLISTEGGILTLPARASGYIDFRGTGELITWSRETPAEWTAQLRAVSPKSDDHGWLELVWEPGDRWVPGQRWTLYEMEHEQFVDDERLDELNGPHPRSEGHFCSTKVPEQFQCLCRRKLETWRGGPCGLITLTQWRLWRETGYFGTPFFIIQGDRGGHKFAFSKYEQEMRRLEGKAGEPPSVGDLPYAPFDARVLAQIVRRNRLRQMGVTISEFKRTMSTGYAQHSQDVERELRAEYVKWFDEQLLDVNDAFLTAARKGDMEGERKTSIDYNRVEEIAMGQYIETGVLPSAIEIHRSHRKLY